MSGASTFGVIGLGRMGYRTVLAGRQAGLCLTSVLDPAETPWGVTQEPDLASSVTRRLQDFLANPPEVVAISTTADSHAELFAAVVEASVPRILVEKPVATSVAAAERMSVQAREGGVCALVNHNNRAWSAFQRIRGFSGAPEFGDLRAIVVTQGAGGFGNLGTHYVDLANWMLAAAPVRVAAFSTRPEAANPRGAQFDDPGGVLIAEYPGGRRLTIEIGDDVGAIGGIEFRFELGRVLMPTTSAAPVVLARRSEDRDKPKHLYGLPLEPADWGDFSPPDIVGQTAAVLSAIVAGKATAGATLSEARDALQTTIAARLSAETGRIVDLPLDRTARERAFPLA